MPAYARLEGNDLIAGNDLVERRWTMTGGRLLATSLLDKSTGRQWCRGAAPAGIGPFASVTLDTRRLKTPVSREFLRAEVTSGETTLRCDIYDDVPGITVQVLLARVEVGSRAELAGPTGIEADPPKATTTDSADLADCLALECLHCDLVAVEMLEQTDIRENLVFEKRWMVQPAERLNPACGNIFFIEHRATGNGLAILKHAPAPYARPNRCDVDCSVIDGVLQLRGLGLSSGGRGVRAQHDLLCRREDRANGRPATVPACDARVSAGPRRPAAFQHVGRPQSRCRHQ